jgi:DNA-binding NarL/FixJ family response regulator
MSINAGNQRAIIIVLRHAALRSSCHKWLAELFPFTEIIEASTGYEGINQAAQRQESIVLLDLELPDMQGIEAMHTIKNTNLTSSVIMLSFMNEINSVKQQPEPEVEAYLNETDLFYKLPSIIKYLMEKSGSNL